MRLILFCFILLIGHFNAVLSVSKESKQESLRQDSEKLEKLCTEYAKFYEMSPDIEIKDITQQLLESTYVKDAQKQLIRHFNRRILVFTYPSDGLKIKGFISFVPDPQNHPVLVFLRGGNRIFGLLNPAGNLLCPGQYTVISTMYRGGVSEGLDEYGGRDVNDVKNLIEFIPELENQLTISLQHQKKFLVGGSRGGMQMFLALARFPELQSQFSKIVSLSGLLDMQHCIDDRSDMEEMFIADFGLEKGKNEEEWINHRNPLLIANQIKLSLPILIIQGTHDQRVGLEEGYHMISKLQANGNNVTYWEIEGGTHCLSNIENRIDLIVDWLEQ